MLIIHDYFKFLSTNSVWLGPKGVIFFQYLTVFDYPFKFIHNSLVYKCLFANHHIILVVRVVCISKFSFRSEFEF